MSSTIKDTKKTALQDLRALKMLLCILVLIAVALIILVVKNYIQSNTTGQSVHTNSIEYFVDPDLIINKTEHGDFYPIGIITSNQEFEEIIQKYSQSSESFEPTDDISDDFDNSNYLVLGYTDYCDQRFIYRGQDIGEGKIAISIAHEVHNGYCATTGNLLFIQIPKNITSLDQISYNVSRVNNYDPNDDVSYKPIIYLYPESEANLDISLGSPKRLTTTYPKYQDGWHINAHPDGSLTDLATGRELYSLYWEGIRNYTPDMTEGFVVKGEDSAKFLEEKLDYLGLNSREAEEFIIYWLPKLENSPYNIIRFESATTIENDMSIIISQNNKTVNPDTLIRVRMAYKPVDRPMQVKEQQLPPGPARHGFTVVEWGGTVSN